MFPSLAVSCTVLAGLCLLVRAEDPRAKPTDYPAHAESDRVAIGAEYLMHSFSNGSQTYFLPGYLVVDAAVFPKSPLVINEGNFKLRVNGGALLASQAPNMVAYSLESSGFTNGSGMGSRGPVIGQSPNDPGYPGDGRTTAPVPQAPNPSEPTTRPDKAGDVAIHDALPEGEFHSAQAGYLYFPFGGKTKKIKSLDLVYEGPAGELVVKLF